MTAHKKLKLVTNHKTDKQRIEYRVFSSETAFKTIAPRTWLHLDLPDSTTEKERCECNQWLVRHAIKDNMRKGIELNEKCFEYRAQGLSSADAYAMFANQNNIKQL